MPSLREAATQALEALEGGGDSWQRVGPAIDALRAALAEPNRAQKMRDAGHTRRPTLREMAEPQEPVAWGCFKDGELQSELVGTKADVDFWVASDEPHMQGMVAGPLYTAPPQRPAEPVQEPVAWLHTDPDKPRVKFLEWREDEPGYRGRWIKTPLYTSPPQRKPPATIDEMFDRMDKAPRGVFYGHDPMTIWMEAWRAAEQHHGIKEEK